MNEGAIIHKGRNNNQLILEESGGITLSTGTSFILANSPNIPQPSTTTPSSLTSNYIIPNINPTGSLSTGTKDIIPLNYPKETNLQTPSDTLIKISDILLPEEEFLFSTNISEDYVFNDPNLINTATENIVESLPPGARSISDNGNSLICSIDNYIQISANRTKGPSTLGYQKALLNLETEVKSKSYPKNVKLLAAIIATQEGWNNPSSSQHNAKNPGNIVGTGDAGTYPVTFPFGTINFAKFSTYEKGWIAQIDNVIIPYINGTITTLTYPGATININWLKDEDNAYYKKSGITYKELSSYSYTNGPPTFRQFFNAYAPKCDTKTDPIGYAANVVKTFENYFGKKINIDEPVKNVL